MKRPLTPTVALGLLLFVVQGCGDKVPEKEPEKKDPPKVQITIVPQNPNTPLNLGTPDVRLDAAAWSAECKKDFNGIGPKYRDKVVELTGTVVGFRDDFGNLSITLLGDPKMQDEVRCFTAEAKPWLKVAPGSKVKVKGRLPQVRTGADLGHVEIVEVEGYAPLAKVSAAQLGKDFLANRKDTVEKNANKFVELEGEVLNKKYHVVTLKGEGATTIICRMGSGENKAVDSLKEGVKVKVIGNLAMADREGEMHIGVNNAVLTEPR